MKMKKYIGLFMAAAMFTACENVVDLPVAPNKGTVDFTKYVAVGNSLTAGYSDGGVYAEAQAVSYPVMIAEAIKEFGGDAPMLQPIVPGAGSGHRQLTGLVNGSPIIETVAADAQFLDRTYPPLKTFIDEYASSGTHVNMGVPDIRALDVTVPGYGADPATGNPFFYRMLAEGNSTASYIEAVTATNATFFTCWIGNNDVLGYATTGGAAGIEGAPGTYLGGLTPKSLFTQSYGALISALTANGAKGLVATIPDVTAIPYFTTVPGAPIIPLDEATAGALNAGYNAQFNRGVAGWNATIDAQGLPAALKRDSVKFIAGPNYPVIVDEALSDVVLPDGQGGTITLPKYRHLRAGELLLLTTPTGEFASGLGTATAIESKYTLTASELSNIAEYTAAYNDAIKAIANGNPNIALWDANASFNDFVTAGSYTQVDIAGASTTIAPAYITGNAFSLDGVHATPRGYAWAANNIINTINSTFGTNLGPIYISQYRGNRLP